MAKIQTNPLPIFGQDTPSPRGIARLALCSTHSWDGHMVEFREMPVRSILNRSVSKRLTWMAWSINPYRGCEFACRYCYARYTHEFMAPSPTVPPESGQPDFHDPATFERLIFLKQNAAWLLEQELHRFRRAEQIAIGTATDPWQPIERRARITRSLLEVFARRSGYNIGIVTKSRLILRDTDLLREIAKRSHLVVHITITTPDIELARLLEPRAPRPDLRFDTVRRLREAGIVTGILCSPLMPGITDTAEAINRMAMLAAQAGASFFAANPLFLKPCSRPTCLSFVREHFPALVPDYERRFAHSAFASREYTARIGRIVSEARTRHGLNRRWREDPDDLAHDSEGRESTQQTTGPSDSRPMSPAESRATQLRKAPAASSLPEQQRLFA